jgi:hypothetical protein
VKHIGIVACSAEGAALCYQTICRDALELVGKNDHPRVTLDSIPMARWLPAFDALILTTWVIRRAPWCEHGEHGQASRPPTLRAPRLRPLGWPHS